MCQGLTTYAEIHTDECNMLIHIVGMPFVMYSVLRGLPNIFDLNKHNAFVFNLVVFNLYNLFYAFSGYGGYAFIYYPIFALANRDYRNTKTNLYKCVLMLGTALYFQEIAGHTLFEYANSRIDYVGNAVLYAPLFSAVHTLQLWYDYPFHISFLYGLIVMNFL